MISPPFFPSIPMVPKNGEIPVPIRRGFNPVPRSAVFNPVPRRAVLIPVPRSAVFNPRRGDKSADFPSPALIKSGLAKSASLIPKPIPFVGIVNPFVGIVNPFVGIVNPFVGIVNPPFFPKPPTNLVDKRSPWGNAIVNANNAKRTATIVFILSMIL